MKNELNEAGPNPFWLAYFEELFRLASRLDRIEDERAQDGEEYGPEAPPEA